MNATSQAQAQAAAAAANKFHELSAERDRARQRGRARHRAPAEQTRADAKISREAPKNCSRTKPISRCASRSRTRRSGSPSRRTLPTWQWTTTRNELTDQLAGIDAKEAEGETVAAPPTQAALATYPGQLSAQTAARSERSDRPSSRRPGAKLEERRNRSGRRCRGSAVRRSRRRICRPDLRQASAGKFTSNTRRSSRPTRKRRSKSTRRRRADLDEQFAALHGRAPPRPARPQKNSTTCKSDVNDPTEQIRRPDQARNQCGSRRSRDSPSSS